MDHGEGGCGLSVSDLVQEDTGDLEKREEKKEEKRKETRDRELETN